jgi:hypothetical protein
MRALSPARRLKPRLERYQARLRELPTSSGAPAAVAAPLFPLSSFLFPGEAGQGGDP